MSTIKFFLNLSMLLLLLNGPGEVIIADLERMWGYFNAALIIIVPLFVVASIAIVGSGVIPKFWSFAKREITWQEMTKEVGLFIYACILIFIIGGLILAAYVILFMIKAGVIWVAEHYLPEPAYPLTP